MAKTPEEEARINACVKFMVQHPDLPTCGAAWRMAFEAGIAFAKQADCSTCGGLRRIEYENVGWCRCPGCCTITHKRAPGNEVRCCITIHTEEQRQTTTDPSCVTCPDCLQTMLTEATERTRHP